MLSCSVPRFGVPLAYALVDLRQVAAGLSVPLLHRVEVDGMALLFTAVVAIVSVSPSACCRRPHRQRDPQTGHAGTPRGSTQRLTRPGSDRRSSWRRLRCACVLLVGAGLLLRTFLRVTGGGPRFRAVARRSPCASTRRRPRRPRRGACCCGSHPAHRGAPGVESAALHRRAARSNRNRTWTIGVPGQVYQRRRAPAGVRLHHRLRVVRARWACGCGAGRELADAIAPTANRCCSSARAWRARLYPGQDAVGRMAGVGRRRACASSASSATSAQTSLETGGALPLLPPY